MGWGLNDADPVNVAPYSIPELNANLVKDFIFNQAFRVVEGDKLSLFVRCTTDARDFIIENVAIFAQEI